MLLDVPVVGLRSAPERRSRTSLAKNPNVRLLPDETNFPRVVRGSAGFLGIAPVGLVLFECGHSMGFSQPFARGSGGLSPPTP